MDKFLGVFAELALLGSNMQLHPQKFISLHDIPPPRAGARDKNIKF